MPARKTPLRAAAAALAAATFALAAPALADNGDWFPPAGAAPAPAAVDPAAGQLDVAPAQTDDYADNDPSALQDFQDPLAPYGEWTQDPTYGTLWVPDSAQVGPDFAPYQSAGQWGVTSTGDWMWQSDYAWGYIPFHYGRWIWTGANWGWVAGRRYSPAWVSWRVGQGGYTGWAPRPPAYTWGAGGRSYPVTAALRAPFCFVPNDFAFLHGVSSYVVRDRGMVQALAASTHNYQPTAGRSSPTLSEAHIPSSAAPRSSARPDGRSLAYATRSSTAAARSGRSLDSRSSYRGSVYDRGSFSSSYAGDRGRGLSGGLRTPGVGSRASGFHSPSASYPRGPHYGATSHPAYRPPSAPSSVSAPSHASAPSHSSGGGGRRR